MLAGLRDVSGALGGVQQERLKRRILEDIQRQLASLLAARGVSATLELTHAEAIVTGAAGKTRVELGELPSQWRQLTPQQRTTRLEPLVERLRRGLPSSPRGHGWPVSLPLLGIALLTAVLGGAVIRDLMQHRANLAKAGSQLSAAQLRQQRSQRVCEATRSRVMRGGTAGPADHEGWLVELVLVGEAPVADAGADVGWEEFFTQEPGGHLLLRESAPGAAELEEGYGELIVQQDGPLREQRFVLHDGYARAYFDELGRRQWTNVAGALFAKTGARYGALVARCAHQRSHHIGSWFAGNSVSAAASALLHYTGAFSETPVFVSTYLPPSPDVRPGLDLLALFDKRTDDIDRTQLAMWLSPEQGTVSGRADASLTLHFPYRDSNRASRASLRLARRLGIANSR